MIRKYFISILLLPWVCLAQWDWQHPQPQGNTLWSLEFTKSGVGVAVGDHGTIISTIDNGATWLIRESGTEHDLLSVYFLDTDNGWIFGAEGTILKTADGGKTGFFFLVPIFISLTDFLLIPIPAGSVEGRITTPPYTGRTTEVKPGKSKSDINRLLRCDLSALPKMGTYSHRVCGRF